MAILTVDIDASLHGATYTVRHTMRKSARKNSVSFVVDGMMDAGAGEAVN